jgi:hypothetical protein
MSAMPQLMQRPEVFHRESRPSFRVPRRPQIAGYASSQTLAAIVDLDKLLPAIMAALHAVV